MSIAFFIALLLLKVQFVYSFIHISPSYVWNRLSLRINNPLYNQNNNNINELNLLKVKDTFTLNTTNAMHKFLQKAKDLRLEADDLLSKSILNATTIVSSNATLKSEFAEFACDDIIVNKTVNVYVNNTDVGTTQTAIQEEDKEYGPIIVPRDSVVSKGSLFRNITEIIEDEVEQRNDSVTSILKEFLTKSITFDNRPYTINISLLPDIDSISQNLPWLSKIALKVLNFILKDAPIPAASKDDVNEERVPKQVFVMAYALLLKEIDDATIDDASINKLVEGWSNRLETITLELILSIRVPLESSSIDKENEEEEASDVDMDVEDVKGIISSLDVGLLRILKLDSSEPLDVMMSEFRTFLSTKGITSPTMKQTILQQNILDFLFTKYLPENPSIMNDIYLSTSDSSLSNNATNLNDGELSEILESFIRGVGTSQEELNVRDTAERTVTEYFDSVSRTSGDVLTRSSAGRLQTELLKDVFLTSTVSMKFGAVVFSGRPVNKNTQKFANDVAAKYARSRFKDDFKYFILMNNKYSSDENSDVQNALESLSGTSTAVVMYPSSWNSTTTASLRDEGKRFWRSAFISASFISSGIFAASLIGGDNPFLSDDYLPLSFGAIFIQTIAIFGEALYAALRNFSVSLIITPSLRIGSWGPRTLYTCMPANLNDLFDASFVGVASSLVLSFFAILIGLDITANADMATVATMPALPQGIIKASNLVSELVQWKFPSSLQEAGSAVHLHWLAISGIISMIATIFQIIPIDNSAGSKMSYAALGVESFSFLNAFALFVRLVFLLPFIFDFGATSDITTKALLVDFFFISVCAGNNAENQIAIDNITEISDGRKTAIVGLILLLLYSFLPYGELYDSVNKNVGDAFEYLSNLVASSKK